MANIKQIPTVHIISDSLGETAKAVAQAACAQFGVTNPKIEVFGKVGSFKSVKDYLTSHMLEHKSNIGDERLLVFYTIVSSDLRDKLKKFIDENLHIYGVDLLTDAICAISDVSGLTPKHMPGSLRFTDMEYYKKIGAIEFTIAHDDGRKPEDLIKADIVIIGVSRTSKTPTSIYLAQSGYKVANVPLDLSSKPPKELLKCDPKRLFGLMSTPEVLKSIRMRRLSDLSSLSLSDYADVEKIYEDLKSSREFMRKLGCIVVHTDGRAVEETASEILKYYHQYYD